MPRIFKPRIFKIEQFHRKIISKQSLFKVLTYLDKKTVETPFLLVDKEQVERKVAAIGANIENSKVFYAVKANPDIGVLRFLNGLGTGFEIASEGELRLLATLGVSPERIISSNPVKSFGFLEEAKEYGVGYFAFDSKEEADKFSKLKFDCNLYVRLSVPNEGSEWPLSRKFGLELHDALALVCYAKGRGLNPVGITFHVGSQCTNIYNWNTALYKAKALWEMAGEKGIKFRLLNIGGGYPIKYTRDVVGVEAIEKNVNELIYEKFPGDADIFIEPGRAVVGDAGVMVGSVIGKAERGSENWLYIDVGVFNGLMESLGGIRYSYIVEAADKGDRRKKQWTITGPSCDSFDVIDGNVSLPEPDTGGLVLILSSGAYTVSYASESHGFKIPKTILI